MSAVKTDQSEDIPGAGIPEQAVKKMLTGSAALSLPSSFAFFRALFLNSRFPHYLGAPSLYFRALFLNSRFPHYLGAWDRLAGTTIRVRKAKMETMSGFICSIQVQLSYLPGCESTSKSQRMKHMSDSCAEKHMGRLCCHSGETDRLYRRTSLY